MYRADATAPAALSAAVSCTRPDQRSNPAGQVELNAALGAVGGRTGH